MLFFQASILTVVGASLFSILASLFTPSASVSVPFSCSFSGFSKEYDVERKLEAKLLIVVWAICNTDTIRLRRAGFLHVTTYTQKSGEKDQGIFGEDTYHGHEIDCCLMLINLDPQHQELVLLAFQLLCHQFGHVSKVRNQELS
jgi:hypothetical protein